MCSKEEVQQIVDKYENKMEKYVQDEFFEWHKKNSDTFSNLVGDLQGRFTVLEKKYDSVIKVLTEKTVVNADNITKLHEWKLVKDVEDTHNKEATEKINTTLSRIMWLVITGVIIAVLGLVLK